MSIPRLVVGKRFSENERFKGVGYFGGLPPPDPNPLDLDGRAKVLNVPTRVRINVYERRSMLCVASTLSDASGVWRIDRLSLAVDFVIIGFNGAGTTNAAIQDWARAAAPDT